MKLVKLLWFMEDPRHPCLGPHLRFLGFIGVWHPEDSLIIRFKLAIIYLNIAFFLSQYIKCCISFSPDSLSLILQYAPFHLGVAKTCFFQIHHKKWERLITFISGEELRQIAKKDNELEAISDDYICRSRRMTYFLWTLALFANFIIFYEPYQTDHTNDNGTAVYVNIFDGYTPFGMEPPGYYYGLVIQTVFGNMMSAYIIVWDMLVVSIMIFFAGQLRASKLYCQRAILVDNMEDSRRNVADCHRFHMSLIEYQNEFNELISPVMFIYLVVIAITLGVQIIEIAKIQNDVATLASGCVFVMTSLTELLLFYWHSNEVTVESEQVSYRTFQSNWVDADVSTQKELAILALATGKRLVFRAGPFNEMSLATFVLILRSSYSFYTLLNGTNH